MSLIACDNVSFSYEGKPVLENLNLQVEAGDFLCVVGENGSGKTTLVKGLLGLLPPAKGRIALGDGVKRSQIGYLPQQSESQRDFPASVWEVVSAGSRSRGPLLTKQQKDRVRRNMERMNVLDLKSRSFTELSGGQRQRVLLARALCAADQLLLLDEPTAGLDPLVTVELYRMVAGLHRQGMTIIMITHDIPAALQHARHILHLSTAENFYGTTAQYASSPLGKLFAGGTTNG